MLESGDDLHFTFEVLDSAGFRLGAGEHEFHRHRIAGNTEVTIRHPPEQKGVVLGESKGF
jgi:hypothetical protein